MADTPDNERLARQMDRIEADLRTLRERLDSLEKAFWLVERSEESLIPDDMDQQSKPELKPLAPQISAKKTPPPLKEVRQAFAFSAADKAKELIEPSIKPTEEPSRPEPQPAPDPKPEIKIPDPAASPWAHKQLEEENRFKTLQPGSEFTRPSAQPWKPAHPAFDWRELLRRLKIFPPINEGNVEIQLGAWWATRIGILLAIIGAVFFGVYVSRNTPPWVKFAELCAAGIAVTGFGLWLERKLPRFGAVVFAGGLALDYFAAFAGYALPATKVIDGPIVADILQAMVVIGLVLCAEWRRSAELASMAVFLGFVTCFFSIHANLNDFALIASGFLGAAAIWFYLRNGWNAPYQLAVPLAYLVYAVVSLFSWSSRPAMLSGSAAHRLVPAFPVALAYPLAYMILFGAADYVAMIRNRLMPERPRRLVQICNTTGAIVLGYIVTKNYFGDQIHQFYFVFGAVLIAASIAYYLTRPADIFSSIYFAKGSALITLGIIARYRAQTRWIALLVESFVLLLSARRSRRVITEIATIVVWLISAAYFLGRHNGSEGTLSGVFQSLDFWLAFFYALASAAVLALHERWFGGLTQATRRGSLHISDKYGDQTWLWMRSLLVVVFCLLILGPYICAGTANAHLITDYPTLTYAMLTVGLCFVAGLTRSWIPLLAGVFPFFVMHGRVWGLAVQPQPQLWANGAIAIGITWALLAALFALTKRIRNPVITGIGVALQILWLLTLSTLYTKTCSDPVLLFVATATALLLACVSYFLPAFGLAEVSVLPLITAISVCMNSMSASNPRLAPVYFNASAENDLLWISTVGIFLYAVFFTAAEDLRNRLSDFGKIAAPWVHTFVAVWATLVAMAMAFESIGYVITIQIAALLVLLLYRWPGLRPALYGALVLTAAAHMAYWSLLLRLPSSVPGRSALFLYLPISAAVLTAAFPPLSRQLVPDMRPQLRKGITWGHGILALLMLYLDFVLRTGPLAHYITVFWGLSATALLIAGLALRIKPYRIIAMAGLALCIPRIFLVDTRSTFYRIIAFFAMGLALLVIGLLYNKYRAVIENWEKENA